MITSLAGVLLLVGGATAAVQSIGARGQVSCVISTIPQALGSYVINRRSIGEFFSCCAVTAPSTTRKWSCGPHTLVSLLLLLLLLFLLWLFWESYQFRAPTGLPPSDSKDGRARTIQRELGMKFDWIGLNLQISGTESSIFTLTPEVRLYHRCNNKGVLSIPNVSWWAIIYILCTNMNDPTNY